MNPADFRVYTAFSMCRIPGCAARRRNAERSQYEYEQQERDLLDRRGLPAPEPDPEPAPEAAGQVWQAAPDVPDEPSFGAVQHDAPEREPVPTPDGSEADGRECSHRSGERKALRFCHFEDEIDRMLRTGSNFEDGKILICGCVALLGR